MTLNRQAAAAIGIRHGLGNAVSLRRDIKGACVRLGGGGLAKTGASR